MKKKKYLKKTQFKPLYSESVLEPCVKCKCAIHSNVILKGQIRKGRECSDEMKMKQTSVTFVADKNFIRLISYTQVFFTFLFQTNLSFASLLKLFFQHFSIDFDFTGLTISRNNLSVVLWQDNVRVH